MLKNTKLAFRFLLVWTISKEALASNTGTGSSTWGLRENVKTEQLASFFLDFSEQLPWWLLPRIVEWVHPTEVWGRMKLLEMSS